MHPTSALTAPAPALDDVLRGVGLRALFQPIMDLDTGRTVAYEALARGPLGTDLESPTLLLDAARSRGVLAQFDWHCRLTALEAAAAARYPASLPLFLNSEPGSFTEPVSIDLWDQVEVAARGRSIVMEFTERSLSDNPRAVLEAADWARMAGMYVALDDVGTAPMSLALLHILRPDVVKLDLRLIQQRDGTVVPIVQAVLAYAERVGAVVLAEGIETEEHVGVALSLGATVGQGWLYGRPGPLPSRLASRDALALRRTDQPSFVADSPFDVALAHTRVPRQATRRNLLPLSVDLEHSAERQEIPSLLLASFQHADRFTAGTAVRYARLAETCALVAAFGVDMPPQPAPGVRGIDISPADAFAEEWTVIVVGAHHSVALIARPAEPGSRSDASQVFDFIVTHDRDVVVAAARHALRRIGRPASMDRPIAREHLPQPT